MVTLLRQENTVVTSLREEGHCGDVIKTGRTLLGTREQQLRLMGIP